MAVSVLLVGRHGVTQQGLEEMFRREPQLELVANMPPDTLDLSAPELARAQVALLDVPEGSAPDALALSRTLQRPPHPAVVLYQESLERPTPVEAFAAGASAVVCKGEPLRELARAVVAASRGHTEYASPMLAGGMQALDPAVTMSERQRDVLRLLADGLDNEEIARRLDLSTDTVKFHVKAAMTLLGVNNRTAAVAAALRLELIG